MQDVVNIIKVMCWDDEEVARRQAGSLWPFHVTSNQERYKQGLSRAPGRPQNVKKFSEMMREMQEWPEAAVKEAAMDPEMPMVIRSAAIQTILVLNGDDKAVDRYLERMEGRVPTVITLAPDGGFNGELKRMIDPDDLRSAYEHMNQMNEAGQPIAHLSPAEQGDEKVA